MRSRRPPTGAGHRTEPVRVLGIDETRRGKANTRRAKDRETGLGRSVRHWAGRHHRGGWPVGAGQRPLGGAVIAGWPNATRRGASDHPRGDRYVGDLRQGRRDALPHAQLIVDRFHLVKRANQMVEAVRRRTTWVSRGRRGRKADPEWLNRRRLLRGAERLTEDQRARLIAALDAADPNGDILAAWIAKELLRDGWRAPRPVACVRPRRSLVPVLRLCAATSVPEIHDLAETIETWQAPMISRSSPACPMPAAKATTASSNMSGASPSDSAT